jgi:hypothetical protein
MKKSQRLDVEIFPILREPAAAVEPCNRAFDNPAFGQHDKTFGLVAAADDLDFELRQDFNQPPVEDRAAVGGIGKKFLQKREHAKQRRQQQDAAVAILNAGGVNEGAEQKSLRIYEDVPLFALDNLARVKAVRIDAGPPFSALFTLWLSMMQAVGLTSRPACSRHFS